MHSSTIRQFLLAIPAALTLAACAGESNNGNTGADTAQTSTGAATSDATTSGTDTAATAGADTAAAAQSAVAKINLNTATEEQFRTIPGVGDKMVHEFEEYRPYKSINQFRKEIGKYVDASKVAEYEKYVFVPIDYNESDMETLTQIPGVDMSEANQLVTARPFASESAFFEMLSTFVSPEQLEIARTYVTTGK